MRGVIHVFAHTNEKVQTNIDTFGKYRKTIFFRCLVPSEFIVDGGTIEKVQLSNLNNLFIEKMERRKSFVLTSCKRR